MSFDTEPIVLVCTIDPYIVTFEMYKPSVFCRPWVYYKQKSIEQYESLCLTQCLETYWKSMLKQAADVVPLLLRFSAVSPRKHVIYLILSMSEWSLQIKLNKGLHVCMTVKRTSLYSALTLTTAKQHARKHTSWV